MKYVLNPKRKTSGNCNKGSYNLLITKKGIEAIKSNKNQVKI